MAAETPRRRAPGAVREARLQVAISLLATALLGLGLYLGHALTQAPSTRQCTPETEDVDCEEGELCMSGRCRAPRANGPVPCQEGDPCASCECGEGYACDPEQRCMPAQEDLCAPEVRALIRDIRSFEQDRCQAVGTDATQCDPKELDRFVIEHNQLNDLLLQLQHTLTVHFDQNEPKTEALRNALDAGKYDAAFGGARRDEEASRAKERIYSFRTPDHRWDPRNQRPELWNVYNGMIRQGESVRAFPLSNWTEVDIWRYIQAEDIPIVPLYFAEKRPYVERDGMMVLAEDPRLELLPGEVKQEGVIRFRTLGCFPLTGAIRSNATTLDDIIAELETATVSERQGRAIDRDQSGSMEKKKREGYF